MTQEVYVVCVTYTESLENVFCYRTKKSANSKALELMKSWANTDSLNYYLKQNNLTLDDMTLELYEDYFLYAEDDITIICEKVTLED